MPAKKVKKKKRKIQKNPLDIRSVMRCRKCITLGAHHVPSDGDVGAQLMIVGQSPGKMEIIKGKPFAGPSGELLDHMLDEVGLSRDEVYIANALKCRPPGNRAGHPEEIRNCHNEWLHNEIALVNPDVLLILGRDAHYSIAQNRFPFTHRGVYKLKNRTYITSWHPAYCLRKRIEHEFIEGVGILVKEALYGT